MVYDAGGHSGEEEVRCYLRRGCAGKGVRREPEHVPVDPVGDRAAAVRARRPQQRARQERSRVLCLEQDQGERRRRRRRAT
jgi:hypothetical protein